METFDAIIVGGGLAGLSAAYTLAEAGKEVLLLERGDYSGAKNVTGGRMYVSPIRDFFPDLWAKAPLERFIAHEEINIMAKRGSLTIRYDGSELPNEPYQSYSVLRSKFDRWLAKQAERKGASLITKTRVDELIIEDGQVLGVWVDGDELRSNVVIACDGVLSFIAEKAGLGRSRNARNYAIGLKEVIELDRKVLEDRFNLEGDEGVARLYLGDATAGKFGGGFLYTNKESLSLGVVVGIGALAAEGEAVSAPELLENFKQRPEIARLIKDGHTAEYSAHVISEGGYKTLNKLYGPGLLVAGEAAGFAMNIGITVRGMEYAVASGYLAAQTVIKAAQKNDFSAESLAVYEKYLADSFVLQDFKSFQEALSVLETPYLFGGLPEFAGDLMRDLYNIPAGPKPKLFTTFRHHLKLSELWALAKALGGFRKI
jgi:electron transfer flavoprotein-quinone oxidoreductase